MIKRCFDVAAATVALVALSPLLGVCALAVKLDTPGPVLFRHRRVGRGGQGFDVWKFRTMVADHDGPEVTTGGESRITRSGRLLRRHKLDELPQLVNVLAGQMSVVGPRPEVRRYVNLHPDEYRTILSVRPGLTDPASMMFRDEEEILARSDDPLRVYVDEILPTKVALSCRYVHTRSVLGDLRLIVRTLSTIAGPGRPGPHDPPAPMAEHPASAAEGSAPAAGGSASATKEAV